MLISFAISNWASFRDRAEFSMIASKERQHGERLTHMRKIGGRVLPAALIFGGNAAGKSNFCRALGFARQFILNSNRARAGAAINTRPFYLDPEMAEKPSVFEIVLSCDDEKVYRYEFAIDHRQIYEERLTRLFSTSEKLVYSRKGQEYDFREYASDQDVLKLITKTVADNQLFLTVASVQKVAFLYEIYKWFESNLVVLGPDSHYLEYGTYTDTCGNAYERINALLGQLDTGIVRLENKEIPIESIPQPIQSQVLSDIREGTTVKVNIDDGRSMYMLTRENGIVKAGEIISIHKGVDGKEVSFKLSFESDGTRRIIDLLPAFIGLASGSDKTTFVIDEIDRCLHHNVLRKLLELFLNSRRQDGQSQLIFTTQDLLLMNQELFRRDEMWIATRNERGASSLDGICDFEPARYDKDILRSYLLGRMRGVPHVGTLHV